MMNNTNLCTNMVGQQMTQQQMMQQQIMQMNQMMQQQAMQMTQQQMMQMTPQQMMQMMQQQMMQQQMMPQQMMPQQMMQMNPQQIGMNNCQIQNHIIDNKCFNSEKKIDKGYIKVLFIWEILDSNCPIVFTLQVRPDEKVRDIIKRYRNMTLDNDLSKKFIFNAKKLDPDLTVAESNIYDNANIFVVSTKGARGSGGWLCKEINIRFIKVSNELLNKNLNFETFGLLKLCLLKEISLMINKDKLKNLPDLIRNIIMILREGYIAHPFDIKEKIKAVLKKLGGSNIINFSNYIDEVIDSNIVKNMISYLSPNKFQKIRDIGYRLSKYNKYMLIFDKEFEKAKKESIFEFSVISLVIIERKDFEKFEKEREKCPNRIDRILFHGTTFDPISCILTDIFKKSVDRHFQHGKGVYFTDLLDYCWFYGGINNRINKNVIPMKGDTFTLIASSIYYNKAGYKRVYDYKYSPQKNEINFAYAGANFETIYEEEPDKSKFLGTEYVIWDLDQICPFMSATLKRNEYCAIWRDNNFSSKPVYNNKFDNIFKHFLKERMKYIKQYANFNIYPCVTSEEALQLVRRKKYNKIILISNVGTDLGGKKFIEDARKIIVNDVICLFLSYNIDHLKWIKNYKNAIFSNEPQFYEEYLQCFGDHNYCADDLDSVEENINSLIAKIEVHYKVKFNMDDTFLNYPLYKVRGKYSDLSF